MRDRLTGASPPPNESERLAVLRTCGILDTPAEQRFDDLVSLAASICETPIALVSLVDDDRQWFKARVGLDATQTPREVAFCAHAILDDVQFVVQDTLEDARFRDSPLVTGEPHIRFYAGVPIAVDGQRLGTLCVIDREPRTLSPEQTRSLGALARQVEAQIELGRARVEADIARQLQAQFLANVSHELRTPITTVAGYAQLLEQGVLDERESADATRRVQRGCAHLTELIDQLMEVSRIGVDALRSTVTDVDPVELVNGACELLREQATAAGASFRLDDAREDAAPLRTDAVRARQIVLNLVSNAIKYGGEGTVTIRLERPSADGTRPDRLFVEVSDTGPGIAPADLPWIFSMFARGERDDGSRVQGSGLGLYIARELARRLGGDVSFVSEPGCGASFKVELPSAA